MMKCVAAVSVLAHGCLADAIDDYVCIGEDTILEAMGRFCKAMIDFFGPEYLWAPNDKDIERLLAESEAQGLPEMLGSIYCMHWSWNNCPAGWKGQYKGHRKDATIILEEIAPHDLWIWHSLILWIA
jgi:hypothetical protein